MAYREWQKVDFQVRDDLIVDPFESLSISDGETAYLLAHAWDGVIWGRFEGHQVVLSSDLVPEISPALRIETLLEARLFNANWEVYVWRDGKQWRQRIIEDFPREHDNPDVFGDNHILWGTSSQSLENDFTLLTDGAQGLCHAIPKKITLDEKKPTQRAKLLVRNYLKSHENGAVYIAMSRLVDIKEN